MPYSPLSSLNFLNSQKLDVSDNDVNLDKYIATDLRDIFF